MTSINKIIGKLIQNLKVFDSNLTQILNQYTHNFVPFKNPAFIANYFTQFFKIIFYSLVVMIPFLSLKILHPYNRKITAVIIILLAAIAFSLMGIILGFIQIAFT